MRPRHRVSAATAVLGAWAALVAVPATAQTASADDGLSQYEAVLEDPNGVASNLSYAASLQAAGQNGEAQQVYQKVLSLDPNNVTARTALPTINTGGGAITTLGATPAASGAQTDYTLRFGIGYESNSARLPPVFPRGFGDAVGFGEFTVNDTRQLGNITLQSNFDIYSNAHARYSLGDITYATLDTGPVLNLGDDGKLRVAAGTEYVLQGQSSTSNNDVIRAFEFDAGNLVLNWFPASAQALQSVNLLVGYDNFRKSAGYRSGVVMHMTAPFVVDDLPAVTHTQLIVTPGFVYNGANQPNVVPPLQPAHYAEGDLDVLTLTPLAEHALGAGRILGKLGIFADTQYYDSHDPIPTNDRQDIQLIPVVGVRFADFLWPRVQLDLDYRYDRNFSNDAAQRFSDHIVSLIATVRF